MRGTDALWPYMTLSSYVVPLVLLEDFHLRPAPAAHGVAARGAAEQGGVPEGEGEDPRGGAQPLTHGMLARVPKHGIRYTRGEGAESARVFGMWTDLKAILVGRFC